MLKEFVDRLLGRLDEVADEIYSYSDPDALADYLHSIDLEFSELKREADSFADYLAMTIAYEIDKFRERVKYAKALAVGGDVVGARDYVLEGIELLVGLLENNLGDLE